MFFIPLSDDVCTIVRASEVIKLDPQNFSKNPLFSEIESIEVSGKVLIFQGILGDFIEKLVKSCYNDVRESDGSPPMSQEPRHLDNCIAQSDCMPSLEGDSEMAKHKINQYITINGVKRWITADTMQEFAEKVIKLSGTAPEPQKHPFDEYAWTGSMSTPSPLWRL